MGNIGEKETQKEIELEPIYIPEEPSVPETPVPVEPEKVPA